MQLTKGRIDRQIHLSVCWQGITFCFLPSCKVGAVQYWNEVTSDIGRVCAGGIWLQDRRPGSKGMICDARNLYVLSMHWNAEAVRGKKGFRDKLWFSVCYIDSIEAAATSCSTVQCVKEMPVCKIAECCMQCLPIILIASLSTALR